MSERALATIEKILSLEPIEGADKIELAKVRGWNVVVQKDLYEVGDPVIYFEIDTMLPQDDERFESFMSRGIRTDSEGRTGHVVKTIRLKGQYSQGLVMPIQEFSSDLSTTLTGQDVTNDVGVWKWEPPIPAQLSGKVRGGLPGWVRKTDAERIQNFEDFLPLNPDDFYCTEKIDGSSATFTLKDGDFHVCSRNLDLEETEGNTFWEMAKRYKIREFLESMLEEQTNNTSDDYITIQGEIYGEGINGNRLSLKGHYFRAFNFELNGKFVPLEYLDRSDPVDTDEDLVHIPAVPHLGVGSMYYEDGPLIPAPQTVSEALEAVDGMKSLLAKDRLSEGVVWRRKDGGDIIPGIRSVKAISNKYLLKEK